jgi:hypothetical protein
MRHKNVLSFLTAFFVWFLPAISARAVKYEINSKTLWLLFQEEREGVSANLAPLYEFLSIRAADAGLKGLEVNLSLWGNIQTLDWWEGEKTDGKLIYGYLRYKNPEIGIDAKGGRIFVTSGAVALMEQFDGGYFSWTSKRGIRFEIYGGSQFNELEESRKGDWLTGTRISHRWNDKGELGISYLYQVEKNDLQFNRIGIDGWSFFANRFNFNGYLSYDITYSQIADGDLNFTYWTSISLLKDVNLEIGYRSTSSFLGNQSILSVFAFGNYFDPEIKFTLSTGGWKIIPSYEAMLYIDPSRQAHRFSLRISRFFMDGDYVPAVEISRLQVSDDVDLTELRLSMHARIIKKMTSDFDVFWDIFDKKIKIGNEKAGYGFQSLLSLNYEILNWMRLSAGVGVYEGIGSDWNFKGLGKLEIIL